MTDPIRPTSLPPSQSGKRASYQAVTDGDLRQAIDSRSFFMGLGLVMRLPKKRRAVAAASGEAFEGSVRERSNWLVVVAVLATIMTAAGVLISAVWPERSDALPRSVVGIWRTQTPKFKDRGFEIREGRIVLRRGSEEADLLSFPIQRVRVAPLGSSTEVRIFYEENGERQTLDLLLHEFGGATTVEIVNQPDVVWRRDWSAWAVPRLPPGL
jgi:hypothetical protein